MYLINIKKIKKRYGGIIMAKIMNKNNHLKEELEVYERKEKRTRKLSMIFFLLFIPTAGLTFIPLIIVSNLNRKYSSRANILRSGFEGEDRASKVFSKLPDDYYVLSDLEVKIDNKLSQIDNIVVGSNGIFIIETKNLNGIVNGEEEDKEIVQHKVGKKGGQYSRKLYNPIKQVNTHVFRVSEVLKRHSLNRWVQGVVYFTNKDCIIEINSTKVPVFSALEEGDKEIINYITNYDNSNASITEKDKIKIVNILKEFCRDDVVVSDTSFNNNSNSKRKALRIQQQIINREFMEFSLKSVTPFDHGGFIQGEGFNLSDTMSSEMFKMHNNF